MIGHIALPLAIDLLNKMNEYCKMGKITNITRNASKVKSIIERKLSVSTGYIFIHICVYIIYSS